MFSIFGFILSVLCDRSVSISLDFFIAKLTLDVFITDLFKFLLFVVSMLYESFCFTDVVFSSAVFGNRFLSSRLIVPVCIISLFFVSWSVDEFMISFLFLSCSVFALLDGL